MEHFSGIIGIVEKGAGKIVTADFLSYYLVTIGQEANFLLLSALFKSSRTNIYLEKMKGPKTLLNLLELYPLMLIYLPCKL